MNVIMYHILLGANLCDSLLSALTRDPLTKLGINQGLIHGERFIGRSGMCHRVWGPPDPTDTTTVKGHRSSSSSSMKRSEWEDGGGVTVHFGNEHGEIMKYGNLLWTEAKFDCKFTRSVYFNSINHMKLSSLILFTKPAAPRRRTVQFCTERRFGAELHFTCATSQEANQALTCTTLGWGDATLLKKSLW